MLKWIITFAVFLCTNVASVQAASTEVKDLLFLEAHAYRLTADASILSLQEGGARYHRRLDNTIRSGNDVAGRVEPRWPGVASQWQKSTTFVNNQRQVAASNSDVNFVNDLKEIQAQLYSKINAAKDSLSFEETSEDNLAALTAMVALEQMVEEYMLFNVNVFGGLAETETSMKKNARIFRNAVAKMTDTSARTQIMSKWSFIEKTLLNYNQQSATFIVMKTTDKIRELLVSA